MEEDPKQGNHPPSKSPSPTLVAAWPGRDQMCRGAAKGSSAVTATSRRQEAGLRQRRRHGRDVAGGHEAHGRAGEGNAAWRRCPGSARGEKARPEPAAPARRRGSPEGGISPVSRQPTHATAAPVLPTSSPWAEASHSRPLGSPPRTGEGRHLRALARRSLAPSLPPSSQTGPGRRRSELPVRSLRCSTPGGDADPGQRFRERKDSPVCLHNAAVL